MPHLERRLHSYSVLDFFLGLLRQEPDLDERAKQRRCREQRSCSHSSSRHPAGALCDRTYISDTQGFLACAVNSAQRSFLQALRGLTRKASEHTCWMVSPGSLCVTSAATAPAAAVKMTPKFMRAERSTPSPKRLLLMLAGTSPSNTCKVRLSRMRAKRDLHPMKTL